MELLTHSRLSCFRACPRRHYLRFELGLAPERDALALRVGTAFHAALEAADLGLDPEQAIHARGDLDVFDAAMVAAMFTVHRERWASDTLEIVAAEQSFDVPLVNPETGSESRLWRLAGKIDRIYRLPDGRLAIQDYKTTSEDVAPDSDLWTRLRLDSQMAVYVIAARTLGYDVQTILYDVTRRPMQRPFKATPEAERKYVKATGALYANQRHADETPEEFAARVAGAMRAEPERYFARHEIAKLDADLDETRAEIWQQALAIRAAQRMGHWWRNPSACSEPYTCAYLSVCALTLGPESSTPTGYRRLESVHPELARSEQAEHARAEQAAHSNGV